jgi:multidrug efflux pump subunit AcrA (membrane-fusion protein)
MRHFTMGKLLLALTASLLLASCAGSAGGSEVEPTDSTSDTSSAAPATRTPHPTPTSAPIEAIQPSSAVVVASGVVRPSEWVDLGFQTGGLVAEVAVQPGDRVEAGQVLAQLDSGGLEYVVAQAEEALTIAKARLAQAQSGARPEEIKAAEARLAAAIARVSEAELGVEEARAAFFEAEAGIEAARAAVGSAETQSEIDEAQAEVAKAEAQLDAARSVRSAAHAKVDAARAQRDFEQAQLDLLKAGSRVEDLTVLQAQEKQAEATLAKAQADLDKLLLRSPLSGTVIAVEAQRGETVSTGQLIVVLADLDTLEVHTSDVDQLNVARITPGQDARILPDVFPEKELPARVAFVPLRANNQGDGAVYPIIIELVDQDPDLRWGMTVIVEIDTVP